MADDPSDPPDDPTEDGAGSGGALGAHERRNRRFWDDDADDYQAVHGAALAGAPAAWGVWRVPESELQLLGEVRGRDVLEYGCGAAQWSIALAAAGARVVGLDLSAAQLRHAAANARRAGVTLPLVLATAEAVPLVGDSFDLVCCDHGAMSFCDPDRTVPEVARLLRPGGHLVFCTSSVLRYLTWDDDAERPGRALRRSWWELGAIPSDEGTADWVLEPGEWIRRFVAAGLVVEALHALRAPARGRTTYDGFTTCAWARRWPAEELWRVAKP